MNPYPTNGVCVNNQTFLSSLTSSLVRVSDPQSITRKLNNGQSLKDPVNSTRTKAQSDQTINLSEHSQNSRPTLGVNSGIAPQTVLSISTITNSSSPVHVQSTVGSNRGQAIFQNRVAHAHNSGLSILHGHSSNQAHNRLPSTGPSSAVFQLNFPILKNKSNKGSLIRRQSAGADSSKDYVIRTGHKKNHQTPPKAANITSIPATPFRQPLSSAVSSNTTINIAR